MLNVSAMPIMENNMELDESLKQTLHENNIDVRSIEFVSSNVTSIKTDQLDENISMGTIVYENVYKYIDNTISSVNAYSNSSNVYQYINNYRVEVYLYDTNTFEEHARGFVSANFRYNTAAEESICLSTNAGEISSQKGYTVKTMHRTNNAGIDKGGAYGEVNFSWGLFGSSKNKITISCDINGYVTYTHDKS
jgi:hypothetical protein